MAIHLLERSLVVPGDVAPVFRFLRQPEHLTTRTPGWIDLTLTWMSDDVIRAGTLIRYRLKWLGMPMIWESVITDFTENEGFADEMVRGPYARWRHWHGFRSVLAGVEINDRVEYALPMGPLGRVVHAAVVRRQLDRIFDHRAKQIAERFGRA